MLVGDQKPVEPVRTPRRYALAISGTYLVLTCLYIQYSTSWAFQLSNGSVERMELLERLKGFTFMGLTALAFYFSIRWVSKKTALTAQRLHEVQERWMEAERQAAPALLASVIAHDVANLLTVLRLNAELMKRVPDLPAQALDSVAKFERGTDRLMEILKRLRGVSTSLFNDEPSRFDFTKSVEETLRFMQGHACCENATVEIVGEPQAELRGYPVLIHQLVMNLLINACEATGRTGHVRFSISSLADGVSLVVEDNGPGIAPSLREKVLSAFFTTKKSGSGLGLSSVRSCAEIHAGTLEITDSADLGGARFIVSLPNLTNRHLEQLRHPERAPSHARARASEITM